MTKICVLMLVVLLSALWCTQGQITDTENRNLEGYRTIGPFKLDAKTTAEIRESTESRIREFLWESWRLKRRSYLSFSNVSIEGDTTTSKYFVEPAGAGPWHIVIRINREFLDRVPPYSRHHEVFELDARSLERVEIRPNGLTPYRVLPEGAVRTPETYRVLLKDGQGIVLQEL